jgi:hypothetical protein
MCSRLPPALKLGDAMLERFYSARLFFVPQIFTNTLPNLSDQRRQ